MTLYYSDSSIALHQGDALAVARELPDTAVDCILTSPPYYGLRDYGVPGQYGTEQSPEEYVETLRKLFAELRRVLSDDGTLWLNLGDSYSAAASGPAGTSSAMRDRRVLAEQAKTRKTASVPPKNLMGIPWQVAFALQADGWILRNALVWHKPNAMPESITDRLSSRYEMVFLLSKSPRYWFDLDPIREPTVTRRSAPQRQPTSSARPDPAVRGKASGFGLMPTGTQHRAQHPLGRNPGDVWTISTQPFAEAHFAVMALELAERCVQSGCKPEGTVLDPFSGSGTSGLAAERHGRKFIGVDLNPAFLELSLRTRLRQRTLDFGESA
ncbi:DNA-methyltransferase [Nocardia thailandica]